MRFDKRITFVIETNSYYDPIKGEYVNGEVIKTTKPCNLSNLGIERTNELFGQIDKVITVARLQRPYNGKIDYVLINEQKYQVKRQSDYRKGIFYLEGVSNG
ncbi:hypothetical protein [Ornithinibacillus bavariensis]|uniref:hypothetical protein n=1 Tax=Ornithinibacillus bavariensis TaxID=545502 RepID=UPI000EE8765A|nr:hypothetical protein [Ornithinibacillus sp.]